MASRRRRNQKRQTSRAGAIAILVIVLSIGLIVANQTGPLKKRVEQLKKTQAIKQEQLDEEKERSIDLEQERIYVKTMQYVEKKAREMGLVYPDEIVIRPK